MSAPAQITATSKNTTRDFIRPGEESEYTELAESLHRELAPVGALESAFAEEIRSAMWRLRRCAQTEAAMLESCMAAVNATGVIPDPLQIEAIAKLQLSVDRARAQAHRIIHKCTAELRKFQTERQFRVAAYEPELDTKNLGLTDTAGLLKSLRKPLAAKRENQILAELFAANQTQLAGDEHGTHVFPFPHAA